MVAPVIVQGAPTAPDLRDALLNACADAQGRRGCVVRDEKQSEAPPLSSLAIVTWLDGDLRGVRVVVRPPDGTGGSELERDLRFEDQKIRRSNGGALLGW